MQRPPAAKPVAQSQPAPSTSNLVAPVEAPKTIEPEPEGAEYLDEGALPAESRAVSPVESLGVSWAGCLNHRRRPRHLRRRLRFASAARSKPTLIHRVEPYYPPTAVDARLQGLVILEAIIDRDGTVAEVKVLRSASTLLDREAVLAVKQ